MRTIGVLGVTTNSSGRTDGVARGPMVLREDGLIEAIRQHADVHDYGDVALPYPSPERDAETHVIDPQGLGVLVARVRDAVTSILNNGHLPLVIGGDCPLLLGCLAAAAGLERLGLLFVDGHEDAYLPVQSSTGEAADMELAFALGMADAFWSPELTAVLPLVEPADVRILGARDAELLRAEGVPSLGDRLAMVDGDRLAADPAVTAASACASLSDPWWFHLDLDVLSIEALPAVD
jgi:arginase